MTRDLDYRLAARRDLPQLADLRWRLAMDDAPTLDQAAHDRFVLDFVTLHEPQWRPDDLFHFVAADEGRLVAAMSVVIVQKVPAPDDLHGRWGYLTNVYTLPEARGEGVGSTLLAHVRAWARDEALELLIVWPSDRSYPFYERAGFARPKDPLVLNLSAARLTGGLAS